MATSKADTKYLRLVDANLNRAREGLRVIEDTARFVFDDEKRYKEIRALRHRLDRITRRIYPQLLAGRDSAADAGRVIREGRRASLDAILAANFRRAAESLRVLEEYGKLIFPSAAADIKAIRYKVYLLEKNVLAKD